MASDPRIQQALHVAWGYGMYDGAHHKQWVIDQMLRALLTKDEYAAFVREIEDGHDGPKTYAWDTGIAP